jgi:hypothetical protein
VRLALLALLGLAVLLAAYRLAVRLFLQQEVAHLLQSQALLVQQALLAQQQAFLVLKTHTWQKLFKLAVKILVQNNLRY